MAVVGIVPAGGSGERLGADRPKAFAVCAGRPLLAWSLDALLAVCRRVVVAVPSGYEQAPDRVRGGESRSASVRAALEAAPEATIAVVHDAARPLVTADLVRRCVAALDDDDALDGVVAAVPVIDTIHRVDPAGVIEASPERSLLWAAQTPQVFRAEVLRRALEVDDDVLASATDDAVLVRAVGGRVGVVESFPGNIKVTTPGDLRVVESALC